MKKILSFNGFSLNEQENKEQKLAKGFEKYPCVKGLTPMDYDGDGVIEVFSDSSNTQYYPDGTYAVGPDWNKRMKFTCNGDKIQKGEAKVAQAGEKKNIVQKGDNQIFKPYTDPKNPWITTGANKDYIPKMVKDPKGSTIIKDLQKKLYDLKYLKSPKFLTGNFGKWTMQAIDDLCGKYNSSLITPLGIYKETYEKIMNGELK